MPQCSLFQNGYRPQFTGHETFPLRYGWLKKAYDAVAEANGKINVFTEEKAIARFGVGKNMVASIKHWASALDIITESSTKQLEPSSLGSLIFDDNVGLDPYLENPNTIWLLHWKLATNPRKTTWFWMYNCYHDSFFDKDQVIKMMIRSMDDIGILHGSKDTIKRDMECFIHTYSTQKLSSKSNVEESIESPFIELGLIKPVGTKDGYRFNRGNKDSLESGVFGYALLEYWEHSSSTLSFESLAYGSGSPGRVFLLDEDSLMCRIRAIERYSEGKISWSDTAGMKQLIRTDGEKIISKEDMLLASYQNLEILNG